MESYSNFINSTPLKITLLDRFLSVLYEENTRVITKGILLPSGETIEVIGFLPAIDRFRGTILVEFRGRKFLYFGHHYRDHGFIIERLITEDYSIEKDKVCFGNFQSSAYYRNGFVQINQNRFEVYLSLDFSIPNELTLGQKKFLINIEPKSPSLFPELNFPVWSLYSDSFGKFLKLRVTEDEIYIQYGPSKIMIEKDKFREWLFQTYSDLSVVDYLKISLPNNPYPSDLRKLN